MRALSGNPSTVSVLVAASQLAVYTLGSRVRALLGGVEGMLL